MTTQSKWVKVQPTPKETTYINIEAVSQLTVFFGATTATLHFAGTDRTLVIPTQQAAQLVNILSFA